MARERENGCSVGNPASLFPSGAALIIGGSGGIGSSIARQFALDGSDVALSYCTQAARAQALADEVKSLQRKASMVQLELGSNASIQQAVEATIAHHGRIHTLVFVAAGTAEQHYLSELDETLWEKHLREEVSGFFHAARAVLPHFRASGGGSLVHVGSAADRLWAHRDGISIVPKAANEALVRGIAVEEGRFNIRANSVLVGVVEAGMYLRLRENGSLDDQWEASARNNIPMKRLGQAQDIAFAVTFLASQRAGYITGQQLSVSGGWGV